VAGPDDHSGTTFEGLRWMTTPVTQHQERLAEISPQLVRIDPDLDLIATGLINSLSFAELTFLIGKLTGRRPEVAKLTADQFRTLNRISESFLDTP